MCDTPTIVPDSLDTMLLFALLIASAWFLVFALVYIVLVTCAVVSSRRKP